MSYNKMTMLMAMSNSTMSNSAMTNSTLIENEEDDRPWLVKMFYAGFLYHTVPGVSMMLLSIGFLLLCLKRIRSLRAGQSFASIYIPEPNYKIIHSLSTISLCLIVFLTVRQVTGPCFHPGNHSFFCFLNQPGHVAMYGSYASIFAVCLLECAGRVPADSWRVQLLLCTLLNHLLMAGHAPMKPTPEDILTHFVWGDIELYHGVIVALSLYHKSNLPLYLAMWMMFFVKGFWITLAGLQLQTHWMTMEDIRPIFVLLILAVTGTTTFIGAFYGNIRYEKPNNNNSLSTFHRVGDDEAFNHLKSSFNDANEINDNDNDMFQNDDI